MVSIVACIGSGLGMACQATKISQVDCSGDEDCPSEQVCDPSHTCLLPISFTELGSAPTWKPVGWQLYTAPAGDQDEGRQSWLALWPEHTDLVLADGTHVIGPSTPHAPPYDLEALDGLKRAGFARGSWFSPPQWTPPSALFVSGVIAPLPNAPLGSSPDFDRGPVIARPIRIQVVATAAEPPPLDSFGWTTRSVAEALPDAGFDGWSHLSINFWEYPEPLPGPGNYEFLVRLTEEGTNNGWDVRVPFVIEAE